MGAAFRCRLGEYSSTTAREKLGGLIASAAAGGFSSHFHSQTTAWEEELTILEDFSREIRELLPASADWYLLFEYEIPRRGNRPDIVLLAHDVIFLIEFKIGADSFLSADQWQVQSYALDLRDFHAQSAGRAIVPILVATAAPQTAVQRDASQPSSSDSPNWPVQKVKAAGLAERVSGIYRALPHDTAPPINSVAWESSDYRPTPTIIEAAENLFAGHSVSDISHSFATNLDLTTGEIVRAVEKSQRQGLRTVVFVTGTPGAGKTLAGLNAAHDPALRREGRPSAVFLSGNGPLVKIVKEALTRDRVRSGAARGESARVVSAFVANVHQFLVEYGIRQPSKPPYENAIIFDEAQRAWDAAAVMKKHEIDRSEPAMLLEIMARANGWCTVIALVGGGQEIHKGEAGLAEWGRALNARSEAWQVLAAPDVLRAENASSLHQLFDDMPAGHLKLVPTPALHLNVSVRSPRARLLGEWVDDLLADRRAPCTPDFSAEYPIVWTRSLDAARRWLRQRCEGAMRPGLLASSGALRLRAFGIEVSSGFRQGYSYADWFLSGPADTRSSFQLEVAATEFECQGLEVDWAALCWGDDLVFDPTAGAWACRTFRGTKWQHVRGQAAQRYIFNKYRVLLTRARRGMVLWVPEGDPLDATRDPVLLDATAAQLQRSGVPAL